MRTSDFQFHKDYHHYPDIEDLLFELFKAEYVYNTLRIKQYYGIPEKRKEKILANLKVKLYQLGQEVGVEVLRHLDEWLAFHTGTGFADEITSAEDTAINEKGVIGLGGNFSYDLKEDVLDEIAETDWLFKDWLQNEDPEYLKESGLLNMTEEEQKEYYREWLHEVYYDWESIKTLGEHIDLDDIIERAIKKKVFPAWRRHWGQQITVAEKNVQEARERLYQALERPEDVRNLLVAINLALNVQHIHGPMAEHMSVSRNVLKELSNIDTEPLDNWIVEKVGMGENWWKKLSMLMKGKHYSESCHDRNKPLSAHV